MLRGEYRYTLDDKGRVVLPPKFRRDLGDQVVVTRGFDGCLWVYPRREWDAVESLLRDLPPRRRDFQRFLLASAHEADVDRQGRIFLPEGLREYAGIDKEVVVVGLVKRLELWSEQRWKSRMDDLQRRAAEIAEEIDLSL
ncbi:MAG: division/cell wall cluster transcriptional repressor MraZ [Armatimonadota bacterium]|nr:division/cell wall cluster transcriptional repressor MraZ [Armatimonadota bacterium]MDR7449653.1 division/cell wall cluster transcriptional repressor MraZ [Armatimonadota bacterium]MDR7460566.1 division/cell wall cluster transcriptional repressor MraZ [Armatimonadota bacterium]MDR7480816.1 division/cell wall cluster transcriptional repressor MraZ [Armatimonadota bacterium]MDR7489008.1 division/cell wall cluster transcriptional repressor MraZ [Armatimonadota bacterium]